MDPEEELQADNGRTLEPFGIIFMIFTVPIVWAWHQVDRVREWVRTWDWDFLYWLGFLAFSTVGAIALAYLVAG